MATTIKDIRTLRIQVTFVELSDLIVQKATDAGFLDFVPDRIEIFDTGTGTQTTEIVFEKDLP